MVNSGRNQFGSSWVCVSLSNFESGSNRVLMSGHTFIALTKNILMEENRFIKSSMLTNSKGLIYITGRCTRLLAHFLKHLYVFVFR